jgi:hypothetical protein
VPPLPAERVDVFHGCRVGCKKERNGPNRGAPESAREPQDRQWTEQSAPVDFEVVHLFFAIPSEARDLGARRSE